MVTFEVDSLSKAVRGVYDASRPGWRNLAALRENLLTALPYQAMGRIGGVAAGRGGLGAYPVNKWIVVKSKHARGPLRLLPWPFAGMYAGELTETPQIGLR